MELYIVRHGETEFNRANILQGASIPSHLNSKGEKQASLLGKRLKKIKFDHIYTSDLNRAKKTAEIISNELDFVPQITECEELRERNYGDFEGHTWDDVRKNLNTDAQRSVVSAPPNGESLYDVKNRIAKFLDYVKSKHGENDNILVVTHNGAVIMMFLCLLELTLDSHRNFIFSNGSLSCFHIGDRYNRLVLANDVCHLINIDKDL